MPDMNGYEATGQIRKLSDMRKAFVPILALTADAFAEDKIKALQAGMDAHIAKPINKDILIARIKEHL